jgi:hypothetical protein
MPNALISTPLAIFQYAQTDCNCRYEESTCLVNALTGDVEY